MTEDATKTPQTEYTEEIIQSLGQTLPPMVDRETACKVLGGVMTVKGFANADKNGTGPQIRAKLGKKIAYPKDSFLEWLRDMMILS